MRLDLKAALGGFYRAAKWNGSLVCRTSVIHHCKCLIIREATCYVSAITIVVHLINS